LPHAVAPVGAPNVYCCGGERSAHCCGGAEESKGGDGEEEMDGGAADALPCAVTCIRAAVPMRGRDATAMRLLRLCTRWRPWERQVRRRRGFTASGEVTADRSAARSSVGFVKIK
jgi:hypothetical protein